MNEIILLQNRYNMRHARVAEAGEVIDKFLPSVVPLFTKFTFLHLHIRSHSHMLLFDWSHLSRPGSYEF